MNQTLAVVVTYNRLDMLKNCISHIREQSAPCDILIVDNASSDGTSAWAREQAAETEGRRLYYENTGANLGGAGGFQYGMRKACEWNYDYIWIMDDDAFAEKDCLKELLLAAKELEDKQENSRGSHPAFGFLSSAVLWKDGSVCRMNWQRKLHLPKKRSEHHITDADLSQDAWIPIQSATFVSLLFPVATIYQAGLPIKEFFIWCDDIEFTRRIALKNGLPCYVIPKSRIVHQIANNVGTDLSSDSADRIPRYHYAFRNENFMYRQYGLKGFGYYILVCAYNTFKVIKSAPDNRGKRLKVIFQNFFTGLRFNPKIEYLPEKTDFSDPAK